MLLRLLLLIRVMCVWRRLRHCLTECAASVGWVTCLQVRRVPPYWVRWFRRLRVGLAAGLLLACAVGVSLVSPPWRLPLPLPPHQAPMRRCWLHAVGVEDPLRLSSTHHL